MDSKFDVGYTYPDMSKNWNQQLSSYVSSNVIECLEQNIKKQIEFQKTIEYETNEQSLKYLY